MFIENLGKEAALICEDGKTRKSAVQCDSQIDSQKALSQIRFKSNNKSNSEDS